MHYCLGMLTFLLAIFCLTHLVEGTENKDSGLQSNVTGCHGNKKVKHPSDCKKYFYCKGIGKGIEKECADNENFDPDFEMCVWNQIYKCEDRNICNSLKDGTYLNPEKCDSFVKCIGGVAYNQACPKGLWYNAIKESCDHPYNVDCKAYKRTLTTSFINPRDKNQISLDYCKDKINGNYPNPHSCHSYITCSEGLIFENKCPTGLLFDPNTKICIWSKNVKCEGTVTTSVNPCVNKPKGTYPDHRYCDSYIICYPEGVYYMRCPPLLWFNPETKKCDSPKNINCKASKRGLPTVNAMSSLKCNGRIGSFPEHGSCSKYIVCQINKEEATKRCPPGLHYHPKYMVCVHSHMYPCINGTSSLNICEGKHNGTFPNPEACNSYIVCRGGLKYQIECPKPLWFNKDKKQCDFPENVKCEAIRTGASNDTKSDFKDSQEIVNSFKDMTFTETTPLTKTNYYVKTSKKLLTQTLEVTPAVLQTFCSSKAPGNYAHPGRCDGFITCTGISYVVQSCPSGLWFNETQNVCDYPINVHCISWLSKISTTLITETLPSLPSNICVGKKLGNYAHPNSCSVFITCTGVRSQIQSCPRGLWFNEQQNICDYPKNVNCILSTPSFSCFGKIPGSYPAEKCNEYYICTGDELPLKKQCPLHTNFFPKSGMCVLSYSYSCEDPTFCVNQANGMFANPFNCYGYYECINGRTIPRNCDYGLRFNGVSCVDASLYVCQ